jgi:hypothetical protein
MIVRGVEGKTERLHVADGMFRSRTRGRGLLVLK